MTLKSIVLACSTFLMFGGLFSITHADDTLEHPVIKPMPDSVLNEGASKMEEHSTLKLRLKEDGRPVNVEKSGRYWLLYYIFQDANGKPIKGVSNTEVIENYRAAALEKGGQELYRGGNYMNFSVPNSAGGTSWARLNVSYTGYVLKIIDEQGFQGVLTFGADEMLAALKKDGKVAVYGINFDTNKADLKIGAEKNIMEIVKLLLMAPELKLEIQGHTDNTGAAQHNLRLSEQRADTVKKFIVLFGVDLNRLVARGYGMSSPVDTNDTDEGRARNRRVELVKIQQVINLPG